MCQNWSLLGTKLSTAGTLIKSSRLTGISQSVNERRGNYVGPFLSRGGGGMRNLAPEEEKERRQKTNGDQEGGEDEEVEEVPGDDL